MKIYFLRSKIPIDYDETFGFVCVADNEKEARRICLENVMSYEKEKWEDNKKISCSEIGIANFGVKNGIILHDFNAG